MNKSTILLILILLPFICLNIPSGSVHCMTVIGTSMEPTITRDDIVVFVTPDKQSEVGDIISYNYQLENDETVTIAHRVIEVTDNGYRTKGDSLNYEDKYTVLFKDVTGTLLFKIPYIVAIGHFANSLTGYLIMILVPAILIIADEIKKIKTQVN